MGVGDINVHVPCVHTATLLLRTMGGVGGECFTHKLLGEVSKYQFFNMYCPTATLPVGFHIL